ncbi:MAG: FecR domain-containing protein [Betaproteobacteria bacterium]|nr:FecR domain-containing protein [Betaproteobacteria bacterium]
MKSLTQFFVHAALLMGISISAAFAQVATLVELKGAAQAIPAVGSPRDLRMGDALNQGETIATKADATAVIRFEDGQVVALAQNSKFTISTYQYNKMEPAKSSILLTLLDGGMRAVTGLIGKAKPDNVTYKAANATIGIRGTDVVFVINGNNLVISVENGQVSFRVGNGTPVTINAGNGAKVATNAQGAPVVVIPNQALMEAAANTPADAALHSVLQTLYQSAAARPRTDLQGATVSRPGFDFKNFTPNAARFFVLAGGFTSIGGGQNCSQTPKPSAC